uniref:Uncharacterized protein n=1 Tax=Arundo donax TaxID=35708 RepID=A0A0A8ZTD3_ARUDO
MLLRGVTTQHLLDPHRYRKLQVSLYHCPDE